MSGLLTMLDLLCFKGGVFMIPLAIVALAGVALAIERLIFLRRNRLDGDRFLYELRTALKENDLDRAVVLSARTPGLIGRVMEEGLRRIQGGETDIVSATEKIIHSEMSAMEKSRGGIVTVAQVAPLLGILGTVWGMIVAFMAIEQSASTDPKILANGIYQALVTTLAGLLVAIPMTMVQEYVRRECNRILHHLDLFLLETRDWLDRRGGDGRHA